MRAPTAPEDADQPSPLYVEDLEGKCTRRTAGRFPMSVLSKVVSGVLVSVASGSAAAAAETLPGMTPEMGARLDAPAALSFGAVVVAFGFLQVIL